jgi:hypothetical protein
MNRSRFEQLGTPQELYYSPATVRGAFVGANNRIIGKAVAVESGGTAVGRGLGDPRSTVGAIAKGLRSGLRAAWAATIEALPANWPLGRSRQFTRCGGEPAVRWPSPRYCSGKETPLPNFRVRCRRPVATQT